MSTSYANLGGSGERLRDPTITLTTAGAFSGSTSILLDGNTSGTGLFFTAGNSTSSYTITFDFGATARVVDEAKWYQDSATSQGVWQWQGSNDGTTFTNIGSTFTLGSSITSTLTTLSGNVTAYKQYRLQGVSGVVSSSPWLYEIEFKIDFADPPTYSYYNTGGIGNRAGVITLSAVGTFEDIGGTNRGNLINGSIDNVYFWQNAVSASGKALVFDFGASLSVAITEARWYQPNTNSHGTWKWQGSTDNSSWTDIGSSFTLGTGSPYQTITTLSGNTSFYRYYRLLGVSGTTSSSPFLQEIEFKLATVVGGGTSVQPCFFICM